MALSKHHRGTIDFRKPFWETGVNPITMRREESYAVVKDVKIIDNR